ncbi:MAG TPA: nicotinate-nucleotide adenylyltransferase, partial [Terracidiphilus sp.]|nr:nicotinate-nucleotide adenylyltransferase [Terracidiphilus sp.]
MVSHSHGPASSLSASASRAAPRVAFFGGSFDPPHRGHLAIARAAQTALKLDRVLFAPVATQPLKPHGSSASFADRAAMTRLAIAGEPAFELSLLDAPTTADPNSGPAPAQLDTPNYTIDTLERLRAQLPAAAQLFCLIGADSFHTLRRWHCAGEIPFAAALIVASRPGQSLAELITALPPGLTLAPNPGEDQTAPVELRSFTLHNSAGQSA